MEHRHQHLQESVLLDIQLDGLNDTEKDNGTTNFCTSCSLSFVEPSEFHWHMERSHRQTSHQESSSKINSEMTKQHTYECPDCGKCYGVIGHFLNHQRSHRQASKSVFHDLEHLKKKSFQCESCGRNYSRASALDAHRRCHEEKLVKARNRASGDACHTEESVVESKPAEKLKDDSTEEVFKCSCGKAFTALLRLKTHQRFSRNSQCSPEEMKEKPKKSCSEFYCSECKKAFNGHIALFNHQRWHANHSNESATRFPCEECGKVFMTLTFYYRHQRMVHSEETPAKSFHHQVCQLQKKAFECKDCGLKFSRASALHSHQLHHTDVFSETEKEAQMGASLLPQQKTVESETKEVEREQAESGNQLPVSIAEDLHAESDEEVESYGDFNVQVISASESEEEPIQDMNPDLELLCESDQEVRDDEEDTVLSPSNADSKPEMNLKIVQIDFEVADVQCAQIAKEAETNTTEERFHCPECYRWFTSASSLRVHRMWHGIRKRRQQTQGQSVAAYTCDACGHQDSSFAAHCSHIEQHKNADTNDALYQAEELGKKKLTCDDCGKCFSRLSALVSHQLHHPKRKQFQCPDCMMSYSHAATLFNHMKNCSTRKEQNIASAKKEYNPKKTLLGPKIYHCEQCGKGFWSLGAYSHHKQSQTQCADLRLRKGLTGSLHSVNGHPRSSVKVACPVCGRKFRHKGIMALHMRKHENGNHKCELCNRSFRLFSSLLRHQVVHSDQLLPPPVKSFQHQVEQLKKNTYSCPDCGKLFSRAKALQFHMKSHGYETGYSPSSPRSTVTLEDLQCATCFAHFNNKASLKAHRRLCIKREIQFDCKKESSENNHSLKLHEGSMDLSMRESSLQATVKAEINELNIGDEKTENQRDAGNVENLSTADMKYKCKKCDRRFSVVGALNFHKRIHTKGYKSVAKAKLSMSLMLKKPKPDNQSKGPFHCSECERRFMSNSALGSHKRWHKEKTFPQTSLEDDDLKSASHKTEGGPFQCHKCGKQFFNLRVLQRHQVFNPQCQTKAEPEADSKQHPEARNAQSSRDGEFSCPQCNQVFEQGSLLAAHYKNEHSDVLETADNERNEWVMADQVSEKLDNFSGRDSVSAMQKPKAHQCPLCSMTFAKARGLRAHKWQAHSKKTKRKNQFSFHAEKESHVSSSDVKASNNSQTSNSIINPGKNIPVGRGKKKISSDPLPVKSVSYADCWEQCSSAGPPIDHKKMFLEVKQESKQEIRTPETTGEVSLPLSRQSEHTAKCLYKCNKCGKAFPTEEQLGAHKSKAKSRPYCCALCCQGFWTESQLQQHLAWHDEVRCRLPNEVRYRLSAAMTSKPLKPSSPPADCKGKSFPPSSSSQSTLNQDSQSQSSHKCHHCGKAFLSPSALQKHETQRCKRDSYHCSICPRTFSEIQDLIDHHQECIGNFKNSD